MALTNTKAEENLGVVESKSSASQTSEIRKWATKYDTEEGDNYESDDDEEILHDPVCSEARNDVEEVQQESKDTQELTVVLHEYEETSNWSCGAPGYKLYDSGDDEDSSAAWFLNTFHSSDRLIMNNTSNRKLTMIGSHSLATPIDNRKDHNSTVPDKKNEKATFSDPDAMAAELDPLAFELDSLSAKEEEEEEVIFHYDNSEDDDNARKMKASFDSYLSIPKIDGSTAKIDHNESQGEEIFLKVTDAISSLCLTPRSQQQLLEEQLKVADNRSNASITDSTSIEDQNIELELRCSGNKNEVDEIIVVDAVVRALRRSKKRANNNYLNLKNEANEGKNAVGLERNNKSHSRISSDAMDVLMSLTLMECGKSIKTRDISNGLPNGKSSSVSTQSDVLGDNDIYETTTTKAMDILATLNANENTSSPISKDTDPEGNGAVIESDCSEDEEANRSVGNKTQVIIEDPQPSEENDREIATTKSTVVIEREDDKEKRDIQLLLRGKHVGSQEENNVGPSTLEGKTDCGEIKRGIALELKIEQSNAFQQDTLIFEKLELNMDNDSFSIDGFCEKSLSEDNPIRGKPCTMVKKIETRTEASKLVITSPLPRSDFKTISTTMSASFELVASLSSSDDFHIPSPPQSKRESVSAKILHVPSPLMAMSNTRKTKKEKQHAGNQKHSSNGMPNECHTPASTRKEKQPNVPLRDPITATLGDSKRAKKIFSNLGMNRIIRSGRRTSFGRKKRILKSPKTESQTVQEKSLEVDIGRIAEDSLRIGRKSYSLPTTSRSYKDNHSSIDNKEEDQENRSPNPCLMLGQPRPTYAGTTLPKKGIMRVKYEGAPKLPPSNPSRKKSVHWDEKQLASKKEKGIMVGVSSRKCRPIRVLERHMLEITDVQNEYGNELESLLGLRSTSKGYIC
mmetsp:Transcript_14279/g.35845  ORF Transcript_14279/g.35845 Transcript_14279/m.35845 type:complete len:912 (+) Transcript_14279:152-2887(+)